MWRMGFVIIHDKITLHSASRGGQEPSRKHCILFYLFFFTGIKHTISREFSSVTQTLRACLCWKAVQGSQNTQQQVLLVWCSTVPHSVGSVGPLTWVQHWTWQNFSAPNSSLASPWLDLRRQFQTWGSSSRANPAQLECTSFRGTDNHICFYAEWRKCSPPMLLLMLFFLLWQYQEK